MLSDSEIRHRISEREIVIDPFPDDECFQPISIDLRLGSEIYIPDEDERIYLDQFIEPEVGKFYHIMDPRSFVLGSTLEKISLGPQVAAKLHGKSSIGRIGLAVHVTAGLIDPGFRGNITLELCNLGPRFLYLEYGMKIAQIVFHRVDGLVARPYGHESLKSRYQDSIGTVKAKREK